MPASSSVMANHTRAADVVERKSIEVEPADCRNDSYPRRLKRKFSAQNESEIFSVKKLDTILCETKPEPIPGTMSVDISAAASLAGNSTGTTNVSTPSMAAPRKNYMLSKAAEKYASAAAHIAQLTDAEKNTFFPGSNFFQIKDAYADQFYLRELARLTDSTL